MPKRLMAWLGLALVLAGVTVLGWIVVTVPNRVIPLPTPQETRAITDPATRLTVVDSRTKLRNDMRVSLVQLFAALGVTGGVYFTYRTFRLNRDGQVTDRFAKAIDQLAELDKPDVAVGGIYSLARLANDSRVDRRAIENVLIAHIRRLAPLPPPPTSPSLNTRPAQIRPCRERLPTVQAALTLLSDLNAGSRVDLSETDLRAADLQNKNLRGWQLSGANLTAANLQNTDLGDSDLTNADLTECRTNALTQLPLTYSPPHPRHPAPTPSEKA
jgi:hypothetical protein